MSIGWSPLITVHVAVTVSPQLAGLSPRTNGAISGATWKNIYDVDNNIFRCYSSRALLLKN